MIKGFVGLFIAGALIIGLLFALYGVLNEIAPGSASTLVPTVLGLISVLGFVVVASFSRK